MTPEEGSRKTHSRVPSEHLMDEQAQHINRMILPGNFKKDEMNLLKRSFKIASSDSLKPNPRTSMSQLKLKELAEIQPQEQLERFDMEELRDGFFDPIYSKPPHIGDSQIQISTKLESSPKARFLQLKLTKSEVKHQILQYAKNWRVISKFTMAYVIAIVLCLVEKPGSWFGSHRVWLPVSVVINHPVHNVGTQAEITLLSSLGLAIGLGWSSLALYISTATQPTRNHQGGILAGSLFIGLFFMGWFRAYYIRFYYMLLSSGLALIFMSTNLMLSDPTVHWRYAWEFGIPYLFGLLISLFVSIVYIPYAGGEHTIESVLNTTASIRKLLELISSLQRGSDQQAINRLQKEMISNVLALSDTFREFLNGAKFSLYDDEDLKSIRNELNSIASPLRVIPTPINIHFEQTVSSPPGSPSAPDSTQVSSGARTPAPAHNIPHSVLSNPTFGIQNELIYNSIMSDAFNVPLFRLINQMVELLTHIELTIRTTSRLPGKSDLGKTELLKILLKKKQILKNRVYEIDVAYRKFTKTEYFCRDLLNEETVINTFLLLRYTRQAAVFTLNFAEKVASSSERVTRWRLYLPNYPFRRGLRRLPEQCLRDQGADEVFHYFEAKLDVIDAFERIYNLNTSRNKDTQHHIEDSRIVRAIDHKDFNFHSTKNPLRFKLWALLSSFKDTESKYALKVSIVVLFLSLPAWLKESCGWYWTYSCYWCPILVYFFLSPKNSSNWINLFTRLLFCLGGCFWGWAANAARHKNHAVIGVFAGLICVVLSYGFLVLKHPRSTLIGLLGFTIVALTTMVNSDTSGTKIFLHAWTVSVAMLVSIIASVLTSWLIWPFIAKTELYGACASLLQHIGQSYQSVSERYLYRDENDDPTDLTLALANIREVRMSQSVRAVKLLLAKSRKEYHSPSSFKPDLFEKLLDSCDSMLEKMIEARMSGVYFNVWEQDKDVQTTQKLLSFRRDSVATVIYLLYLLSNAFMVQGELPKYLPSAIGIRKKLYDIIGNLEIQYEVRSTTIAEKLSEKLSTIESNASGLNGEKSYEKTHWTEVHGMAFARAFTSITEELENIVHLSKEILGEEGLFD